MHVGPVVVSLLVLLAGCVRHQPHTPAPDSEAAAIRPAAVQPAKPSPPQTAPTPMPPGSPTPVATPATASRQEPVAPPPAPTAAAAVTPATPKSPEPAASKGSPSASATTAAPATLDLHALTEEVKSTPAIGFFSKITLKNQVDDLLGEFRAYHRGKAKVTAIELRRSYDLLLMKVLSLVQDKDPRLASSIVSSREAIWSLLVDPKKFATLQG